MQLSLIGGLERLCFWRYYFWTKKASSFYIVHHHKWICFELVKFFYDYYSIQSLLYFSRKRRENSHWGELQREKEMIVVGTLLFWFWWYTRVGFLAKNADRKLPHWNSVNYWKQWTPYWMLEFFVEEQQKTLGGQRVGSFGCKGLAHLITIHCKNGRILIFFSMQ